MTEGTGNGNSVSLGYDVVWKVVLVGNSGVGKTNLLTRYAWNQFSQSSLPTIGVDFACKDVEHNDKKIRLQIWDTAGQEQYKALASLYYTGALAVILLYDITRHTTFQDITQRWMAEIKQMPNLNDPILLLIGHKYDLRPLRTVSVEEGRDLAEKNSMLFIEASACDDYNVNEAFDLLVHAVAARQQARALNAPANIDDKIITISQPDYQQHNKKNKKGKSKCCNS